MTLLGTAPDNWLSIFKTFGFFLAIAFLVSAVIYSAELKRKAGLGIFTPTKMHVVEGAPPNLAEVLINAGAGFLFFEKERMLRKIFEQFRHDPAAAILSLKINWLAGLAGAVVFGGLIWWMHAASRNQSRSAREVNIWPHNRISEITVWAAVGGIVGAKVFDLFDNWEGFLRDPLGSLLSGGGLAFYGGLILGFICVVAYQYRIKIPFYTVPMQSRLPLQQDMV